MAKTSTNIVTNVEIISNYVQIWATNFQQQQDKSLGKGFIDDYSPNYSQAFGRD